MKRILKDHHALSCLKAAGAARRLPLHARSTAAIQVLWETLTKIAAEPENA